MDEQQPNLMPPTDGVFVEITPPGLTPNTRSEAEDALRRNSLAQTDSAAPTNPDEAQQAYHRPGGRQRAGSTNYRKAMEQSHKHTSVSSTSSVDDPAGRKDSIVTGSGATVPLPAPGEGVVPLRTGVGAGQAEAVKKARPRGMSLGLGPLGRTPSWSEQDRKHLLCGAIGLMEPPPKDDMGYASGTEEKGVGGI